VKGIQLLGTDKQPLLSALTVSASLTIKLNKVLNAQKLISTKI